MKRPPRNPNASVFSSDVKWFYVISVLMGVPLFLYVFMSIAPLGVVEGDPALRAARTELFYLFVFCELALSLTCRSLRYTMWEARPHRLLWASIAINVALTVVLFGFMPGVAEAFEIVPLSVAGVGTIVVICLAFLLVIEGMKLVNRQRLAAGQNSLNQSYARV
jgi:magnesium-transporting ATPase (P-type)